MSIYIMEECMKTYIEFKSENFPPYDDEIEELGPGRWGKRLAEFLSDRLKSNGIEVLDIFSEDWGWVIPIANDDFKLWIGCGNYVEYDNGFLCFVEPSKPYVKHFLKKISTVDKVQSIVNILESIISSESGTRDIRWWTPEEFNSPVLQQ